MQTETRSIHTFQEGELFDNRYRLVKRAGSGGFADVWRAEDTLRKNKVVALKIYTRLDEEDIKEMSDEYDKTEDLLHPNLLTGNHFAAVGNIPYLEMRYCDGGSLANRVGRMGNDELRHMLRDVCSGLAYLHAEGIVHQDIKPENILLDTKHDRYMLADFGISGKSRSRLSKSAKMASDFVAMTAAYAPPEKLSANPMDRTPSTKGDIFSLGVTLYELTTGNLPVDLPQSTGQLLLISQGRQPLYFDNIADPQLRQIVQRCMSYRKEDRPLAKDVLAMLDIMEPKLEQAKPKGRRPTVEIKGQKPPKRPTEPIYSKKPEPPQPRPIIHTPTPQDIRAIQEMLVRKRQENKPKIKWVYIVVAIVLIFALGLVLLQITNKSKANSYNNFIQDSIAKADSIAQIDSIISASDIHMEKNILVFNLDGIEYQYMMVYVDGGGFDMGAFTDVFRENVNSGKKRYIDVNAPGKDESPAHKVNINSFYIGETEVTQALWIAVMGTNPSRWEENNKPVENVSYDDVSTFISRLNKITGRTFRLPTEAEWEFAARGGNKVKGYRYSGNNNISYVAWYDWNSDNQTHSVALKQPNELGLYDMSGNVWEWCSDHYASDYYRNSPTNNPQGPSSGAGRVLRGGGYKSNIGCCRVRNRGSDNTWIYYDDRGFRLALSSL